MLPLFDENGQDILPFQVENSDVEILEALADDDVFAALESVFPEVATHSGHHAPSQLSKDAVNQTGQSVPDFPPSIDVIKSTAANDVSAAFTAPTTKEARQARTRARNRRNQQATRQRQREVREALRAQLTSLTETLKDKRDRWRQLMLHRSALQERLTAASEDASTHTHGNPTPSDSQATPAIKPSSNAQSTRRLAAENLQSHYTQLVPTSAARSWVAASFSHLSGKQTENGPGAWTEEVRRPVSSFPRCEPLSFAAVCDFVAPGEAPKEALKHTSLAHAVAAYQHSVATRTGVPVADICWFPQRNIPGVAPSLSFSANASSPESNLSMCICKHLGAFELMLLVAEHEMLFEASDPTYKPPEHPTFSAAAPPVALPTPPDRELLKRFHIPCGVNQTVPVGLGLERSLKPLLARYRAQLPLQRWRAVCMQAMRIVQAFLEALDKPSAASRCSTGDAVSENMYAGSDSKEITPYVSSSTSEMISEQGMRWQDIGMAVRTAYQHMLCCMHETLQNPEHLECVTADAHGVSLAQVEQRMFEIVCTSNLMYATLLEVVPIFARRTLVTLFITTSQNIASRYNMKLYKQLQLQPDQRACMAERWRSWCRRRAALGHQLAAALARFDDVCPQQSSVSSVLAHCATLVATASPCKAPVDTAHHHMLKPFEHNVDANISDPEAYGSGMHEQSSLPLWSRTFSRFSIEEDEMSTPGELTICEKSDFEQSLTSMKGAESAETEDSMAMHALHDCSISAIMTNAGSMHACSASTAGSDASACQPCILCASEVNRPSHADGLAPTRNGLHRTCCAWAPCMVCGAGRRWLLLGESGEVAKAAYDALARVLDVHTSDALMHFEFLGPFKELTEKQGAVLLAAAIDLGNMKADMVALWQAAAEEESREALFGHLTSVHI